MTHTHLITLIAAILEAWDHEEGTAYVNPATYARAAINLFHAVQDELSKESNSRPDKRAT